MSSRPPISRATAIVTAAVLGVIAAGLLVVFIVHLSQAKGGKVQIGETEFRIPIKVTRLVNDATRAPLFFADARGHDLDIYVSHLGGDPIHGWQAFEAHAPGAGRSCDVVWQPGPRNFRDPCTGTTSARASQLSGSVHGHDLSGGRDRASALPGPHRQLRAPDR
jgi:hypothetical protein